MKIVITIFILFSLDLSLGKLYTECELARELSDRFGMKYREIQRWVCLASHYPAGGGKLDSKGLIESDTDDSFSGIFRIHNAWCSEENSWDPKPEKTLCKIPCSALRSDDIAESVNCAKRIYKVKKYRRQEWGQQQPEYPGRLRECLDALPKLRKCFKK
ncbi:alpha-lactalbumin-like [Chrysoperla carnea]|uniref:alpha-lactalbumin-like n=1 Tax=Chrysoperla carnea TaxID=189513 RepID=UPI001D094A63|nr:alpha-lactalbumin-like [Chrysoperla carnea]